MGALVRKSSKKKTPSLRFPLAYQDTKLGPPIRTGFRELLREVQIKDYRNNQCELVTLLLHHKSMYFSAEEKAYLREQFGTKSGVEFVQRVQEKLPAGHDFLVRSQSRGVKSPKLHSVIHNTSSS
jgi:hypothetical protein